MSSLQWLVAYLCAATLVAGGAMAFAAWSRRSQLTTPAVTIGPALLAGALWPLVLAGLGQWFLVHALGKALRREPARRSDLTRMDAA
ncbi:hypothetical protein ACRDU6_02380 [Mycolicibacterium sp. ELW1]|uniref:hypothetical protein n=1 Tax=Mycobacteriaceae TaxID=1762 RepID=UPI0011EF3B33|nr:hypothetical protein [Mycobacterium sp. ELW1]QEN16748.1 hypothetical protein D3H54_28935 [Mycobacterium sp. ELW1]